MGECSFYVVYGLARYYLVEGPGHDNTGPETGHHQHDHAVKDGHGGEDGHRNKPEPEEYVDLLVDDVER